MLFRLYMPYCYKIITLQKEPGTNSLWFSSVNVCDVKNLCFDEINLNIMFGRKTRFRFSEAERLAAIQETINNICEEITVSEIELWENIHAALLKKNSRFVACRKTLLKDHILEQVTKYKKFKSEEVNESEKERLKTEWGKRMKMLMGVWRNYEDLMQRETAKKTRKPEKEEFHVKNNFDKAYFLRNALLGVDKNNGESISSDPEFEIIDELHSNPNSPPSNTENISDRNFMKRTKNNHTDNQFWKRFFEKSKMDCESRERIEIEKLQAKKVKLEMEGRINIENQQTERAKLELEMKKLEFEKQKYEEEKQQRQLLTELLKSTLLNK